MAISLTGIFMSRHIANRNATYPHQTMCFRMFVAGLFIRSSNCKLSRCSSKVEGINRSQDTYTMEHYTAMENNNQPLHTAWLSLRNGKPSTRKFMWMKSKKKKKKAEEWILGRQCLVGAQGTLGAIMLSLDLSADYTVSAISL